MAESDPLSVLVVDEEPAVLAFIAGLLDNNGMRALLARSAREAVEIAGRGYVPVDVILTDIVVKESADSGISEITGTELVNRLRQIRPDARALYMSAYVDAAVIRVQIVNRPGREESGTPGEENLIQSIRAAAIEPLAFRSGSTP